MAEWDEQALAIEISAILEFEEISIESLGFETAEIDLILDGTGSAEDLADPADEVPPLPLQPVARSGDLWFWANTVCCADPRSKPVAGSG